ncbi:MAG TPA: ferric reductase-like transmembrane domain-containing protein [Gaiellaceae bacterium]
MAAVVTALWYLTRASGIVALLLLTAAVALGVLSALRLTSDRWPRFAITDAHRNLTLASIVFVFLHVVTTVADGYAPIGFLDAFVPFLSPYRPLWLGLGAVSFDLLLALVATSLLRGIVPAKLWRGLHWLAYVSWPIALIHSLGTGSDARFGWLQALAAICIASVAIAALARVVLGGGPRLPRIGGALAAVAGPIAIFIWYQAGPARAGWAERAGTPTTILARKLTTTTASATAPTSFTSSLTGTLTTSQDSGVATVSIALLLANGPRGAAKIRLEGIPEGDGVSMTASGVSFVPATTRSVYTGTIVGLQGSDVTANVKDGAGHSLQLEFGLNIDRSTGDVSGTVTGAST